MATQDPYEPYLQQADLLYEQGDVIKAGQIWQAILKRRPDDARSQAGLRKVRLHFDIRATQEPLPGAKADPSGTHPETPGVSTSVGLAQAQTPEVAALLEQGCILYDKGHVEDALQAWERILMKEPDNALARGYINMARRQLGQPLLPQAPPLMVVAPPAPTPEPDPEPEPAPVAPPAPPAPAQAEAHDDTEDELLRKGCTLFELGQLEDALAAWERLLARNPSHPLAHDYAAEARRQLGLEPGASLPRPATPAAPAAAPASAPATACGDEAIQRRIDEGVQLYEMGMTDEAMARWEAILQDVPGQPLAQGYLEMARKALAPPTGAAAPPAPSASVAHDGPTLAGLSPAAEAKNLLRTAQALFNAHHLAEAGEAYRRILELIPAHPEALHGLRQIQAMLLSAPPEPEPEPEPQVDPEEEGLPPVIAPPPVEPPAQIIQAEGPGRRGLEAPAVVKNIQLPAFLRDTRNQVITLASVAALLGITFTCHRWRKDVALRDAQTTAVKEAESEAYQSTRPYALTFGAPEMRTEIKALEGHEPLGAFLLAQELVRLAPDDTTAPALMDSMRRLVEALPAPAAPPTPEEAQALLAKGDVEGAILVGRNLLRTAPGDGTARQIMAQALRLKVRDLAHRERWDETRDALRLARALFPQEKIWQGRLRLVDLIEQMPKADRGAWIEMLG